MVPEYVPATAVEGSVMMTVGFHDTRIDSANPVAENAVRVVESTTFCAAVACPGVFPAKPVVAVAGPDQYDTAVHGIVSLALPAPVLNAVQLTWADTFGATSPLSVAVITPSCPLIVDVPTVTEPRFFEAGTVTANALTPAAK